MSSPRRQLPVLRFSQLLTLVLQLAGSAVAQVGHRFDEVTAPLADALRRLPFAIEAVQHGGEAFLLPDSHGGAILGDGAVSKVLGFIVFQQQPGL